MYTNRTYKMNEMEDREISEQERKPTPSLFLISTNARDKYKLQRFPKVKGSEVFLLEVTKR